MNEEPMIVKSHDVHLDSEYTKWIHEIKEKYRKTQIKAALKVNSEQLIFNWSLGQELATRKIEEKWGSGIVEQVSLDLQNEFPSAKGFSTTNLWGMNYTWAQQFQIDYQGKDYYGDYVTIRKASTNNMVLDVSGGIVSAGRNVWLYQYNGTLAQQWYIKDAGNGRYYIVSRLNRNYVLDVSGAGSANGTNIHIWPKNGTSAQQFSFSTCKHEHLKRGFFVHDSLTLYSQCADCGAIYNYATWVLPDKDNKGY